MILKTDLDQYHFRRLHWGGDRQNGRLEQRNQVPNEG